MSPIPSFDYNLLYQERVIRSVANNTRQDGENFLAHCRGDSHPHARTDVSTERSQSSLERAEERCDPGSGGAQDRS